MFVLTVGRGTHGFTLNPELGEFLLTHQDLKVPEDTQEFAINASNSRFWEPPIRRYVEECLPRAEYWDVPVSEQTEGPTSARLLEFLDKASAAT